MLPEKPQRKPDFSRLQKILFNQYSSEVPIIELGIDPYIKSVLLGQNLQSLEADIEFMYRAGYDFVKIQPQIDFQLAQQTTKKDYHPGQTAAGADRAWAPESTGTIHNWKDFEQYEWPKEEHINYARLEKVRNLLPEGMGVIGQYGDIFTLAWELMGFENFAMAIYESPELVEAVFDKVKSLILSMFETMAQMDWVGALWYSDDIAYSSNLMINPDLLRKYFFPCLSYIDSLCRKRDIPFIYHSDGLLWDVMDDIIKNGVNALHPIEPKAMDIFEVKNRIGNQLCLCGGMEVDLLARGSKDDVVACARDYLEKLAPAGGYCLGSSNSIPEYVNIENYLAMNQTAFDFTQG